MSDNDKTISESQLESENDASSNVMNDADNSSDSEHTETVSAALSAYDSSSSNGGINDETHAENASTVVNNSAWGDRIKGFITDNPVNDGDRANKWSYMIMIILMLFTVFSVMFGSYQYHARENYENTFTAVYDNDSKTWYTDPMNGRVLMMKQPKNKDMRVFESKMVNPITAEYSKPQLVDKIESYKWKNGMIANITCSKQLSIIDEETIECEEGTIVINIYDTDVDILNYVKQRQIQSSIGRHVITRIDR